MTEDHAEHATRLIRDSTVCDAIVPWTRYGDPALRATTLPRYRQCGFDLVSLSLCSDKESAAEVRQAALDVAAAAAANDGVRLVEDADDITDCRQQEQLALSMNLQGTNCLSERMENVESLYKLGIRQALLTYNHRNAAGGGCHDEEDDGLTPYGRELITEMNRVGMQVDVSHCGFRTSMDAIEASSRPVVFSHSNPRALNPHDRNISDEQALACAASGGWVGLAGVDIFMPEGEATVESFFRQVDYFCELLGPEHVGLGTDFVYDAEDMRAYMQTVDSPPAGNYRSMKAFFAPEQLSGLVLRMITAGYPDAAIGNILGGNYLRVASEVWR